MMNDMSDDPANTRRSQVPGPVGVKSVTEDYAGVGDQAPVLVNASGSSSSSRRLVQQAFHPGLFLSRPRSSSLGSSQSPLEHLTNTSQGKETLIPTQPEKDSGTRPPDWQRVPTTRSTKKRKLSSPPPPEDIVMSNSFEGLPVEANSSEEIKTKDKRNSKPPPIMLYGVDDVNKLTQLLETVAENNKFSYKIINKNQLRITSEDISIYKQLMCVIREHGLIGHTFNRKDGKNYRLVIKNLHHTTPHEHIKQAFESTGNIVMGEIINSRYGPEKLPTSTFFINLQAGPNNKAAKQVKVIYHQIVSIEDPKKRTAPVQCHRCQQYGHSKNYCMRPYRCLKCAESHNTKECPKADRSSPAKCALCLGPHPSNYKGCEVYKEILARKTRRQTYIGNRSAQNTQTGNKILEPNTLQANKDIVTTESKQYAEVAKTKFQQKTETPFDVPPQHTTGKLEEMFLKQSEKLDIILQQMSTLLSLITTLVNKIAK